MSGGGRCWPTPRRIVFGLRERESGVSIGDSRLAPGPGSRAARFSIMIGDRQFRGRGMGTEATLLVCRYGFEQLGLEEIRLEVDPQNAPAVRAYESVGFVHGRRACGSQRDGLGCRGRVASVDSAATPAIEEDPVARESSQNDG